VTFRQLPLDDFILGPLAGPVVAAACLIPCDINIPGIADSKSITEEMRNMAYHHLTTNPQVIYHVVRIEHDEIDSINILQASLKAMRLAAEGVLQKVENTYLTRSIALIDGPKIPQGMPIESLPVIKVISLSHHSVFLTLLLPSLSPLSLPLLLRVTLLSSALPQQVFLRR
jgi:ribonuclease HII